MIQKLVVGELETNCYLFYDEKSKQGIVIDPGADADKIIDEITCRKLVIVYIINTHGHIDHIGANAQLKKFTKAKLLIHKDDTPWLTFFSSASADAFLQENQILEFGPYRLKVLHTPGHTKGSICLLNQTTVTDNNYIFTGDTLFCGGIGRTDLPGGDEKKIIESIRNKLFTLPEETIFYPGHGNECNIGEEKKHNPFL